MTENKQDKMKEEKNQHSHATHKHEEKEHKHHEVKHESEHKHAEHDHKHDHKETKTEEAKEKKEVKKPKKDLAVVRAPSVHMSKRHGMYICSFIKNKSIDSAIADLEQVTLLKKAVPFKGEIPHRKGNIMSGRYPVAAAKIFLPMLKNLKGAVLYNGMDITKARISTAYANFAPRPQRRGGMKGKRAYITIEAREIKK